VGAEHGTLPAPCTKRIPRVNGPTRGAPAAPRAGSDQ
jgi:hypothetical protein